MTDISLSQGPLPDLSEVSREASAPFPAYVRCAPRRLPDLALLPTAVRGQIVALVAAYHAKFEEGDMERYLNGFYVVGDTGPNFSFYEDLPGATQGQAARIALAELFLGHDIRDEVATWNMVETELCYQVTVVTFAEARVLLNNDLIQDPGMIRDHLEMDPSAAPCVIEVFGDHDTNICLAKAEQCLEVVRRLLPPGVRPEAGFCKLHVANDACMTVT